MQAIKCDAGGPKLTYSRSTFCLKLCYESLILSNIVTTILLLKIWKWGLTSFILTLITCVMFSCAHLFEKKLNRFTFKKKFSFQPSENKQDWFNKNVLHVLFNRHFYVIKCNNGKLLVKMVQFGWIVINVFWVRTS